MSSEAVQLSESDRVVLRDMARRMGSTHAAARAFGVDDSSLARAIAGLGVRRGTLAILRAKMLEQPRPAA